MSVEARLQALVQNYRAQYGDAALAQSPQLIAQLSVQAPDLHGEIKALAAAIRAAAPPLIAADSALISPCRSGAWTLSCAISCGEWASAASPCWAR